MIYAVRYTTYCHSTCAPREPAHTVTADVCQKKKKRLDALPFKTRCFIRHRKSFTFHWLSYHLRCFGVTDMKVNTGAKRKAVNWKTISQRQMIASMTRIKIRRWLKGDSPNGFKFPHFTRGGEHRWPHWLKSALFLTNPTLYIFPRPHIWGWKYIPFMCGRKQFSERSVHLGKQDDAWSSTNQLTVSVMKQSAKVYSLTRSCHTFMHHQF